MQMFKRFDLLASVILLSPITGCVFDISKLRPPNNADVLEVDVMADVVTGDSADAPSNTCRSLLEQGAGINIGGSLVVNGNTSGAASTMDPPMSCMASSRDAPEIIYEYQMRAGGTLVAMTDTASQMGVADCPRRFDTVVSLFRGTCNNLGTAIACNDDDMQVGTFRCANDSSRTEATGLMMGQLMAIAVDGYESNAGPFTLTLVENPLSELAPPAMANPCNCPRATLGTVLNTVMLPASMATDPGGGAPGGLFTVANNTIGGPRAVSPMGSLAKGLAVELGFNVNDYVPATGRCGMLPNGRAVFDLLIGTQVVRTFVVDNKTDILRTWRLTLRSLPDIVVGATTGLYIRLRSIDAGCRVGIASGNVFIRTTTGSTVETDGGVPRDS